jgi:hypothetical protein
MQVAVLPLEWSTPDVPPLRYFWRKHVVSDSLIPWNLARDYFRQPQVQIDTTQEPPVIGPYEAYRA